MNTGTDNRATGGFSKSLMGLGHPRRKLNSFLLGAAALTALIIAAAGCHDASRARPATPSTAQSQDGGTQPEAPDGGHGADDLDQDSSVDPGEDAHTRECPPELTSCGGTCVDTRTSWRHCGACRHTCPAGEDCADGVCVPSCMEDHTNCLESCVNLLTDPLNCGKCGEQCPQGTRCSDGTCTLFCPRDLINCDQSCVNPQTDRGSCGGCNRPCPAGHICRDSTCVLQCPAAQTGCGNLCVDPLSDPHHCGECGHRCPHGEGCTEGECVANITSITMGDLELVLAVGDTHTLTATISPPAAPNRTVLWTSSAPETVAVNRSGTLHAINPGQALITATTGDGSYRARCLVTAYLPPAALAVSPARLTLMVGESQVLTPALEPPHADSSRLKWTSSAPQVAQVSENGTVLGASAGEATIILTDQWTGTTGECSIQVHVPITGVSIHPTAINMRAQTQLQLHWTTIPQQPEGAPLTARWSISDPEVGIIDPGGLLSVFIPGHATIELTVTSPLGEIWRAGGAVTVAVPVSHVMVEPKEQAIVLGAHHTVQRTILPLRPGVDQRLRWSSSNSNVAQVSHKEGVITGIAPGAVTITATTPDGRHYDQATFHVIRGPAPLLPDPDHPDPDTPRSTHTTTALSAGLNHSCAIPSSGSLWCWGDNYHMELGNRSTMESSTPVPVNVPTPLPDRWMNVSPGVASTCALGLENLEHDGEGGSGVLWCWGQNDYGQRGNGTTQNYSTAHKVEADNGGGWESLARTGGGVGEHVCAIGYDRSLWCWGRNYNGQLGNGSARAALAPVKIIPEETEDSQTRWHSACTGYRHTCAIDSNRGLWCWGSNQFGQLGLGSDHPPPSSGSGFNYLLPSRVEPDVEGDSWGQVYCGHDYTCGLKLDGSLWCWGNNLYGQLGTGDWENLHTPTLVTPAGPVTKWLQASTGQTHTCAIGDDWSLWCWGENRDGRLGDMTTTGRSRPVLSHPQRSWANVAAGTEHTCAMGTDGTFWCWGSNTQGNFLPQEEIKLSIEPSPIHMPITP